MRHKDLNFIVATEVTSLKPLKPFSLKLLNIIQFACCRFQLNFANFMRQLGTNASVGERGTDTARKLYKADGERASVHQGPPPRPQPHPHSESDSSCSCWVQVPAGNSCFLIPVGQPVTFSNCQWVPARPPPLPPPPPIQRKSSTLLGSAS